MGEKKLREVLEENKRLKKEIERLRSKGLFGSGKKKSIAQMAMEKEGV